MRHPRLFRCGVRALTLAVLVSVCGCTSPLSDGDQAAIDKVTRAYYRALVRYNCAELRKLATDGDAACAQITPENERTPMPTPVEFGSITVENGQTVRTLTIAGGDPCTLTLQKNGDDWLVKTPPGLACPALSVSR